MCPPSTPSFQRRNRLVDKPAFFWFLPYSLRTGVFEFSGVWAAAERPETVACVCTYSGVWCGSSERIIGLHPSRSSWVWFGSGDGWVGMLGQHCFGLLWSRRIDLRALKPPGRSWKLLFKSSYQTCHVACVQLEMRFGLTLCSLCILSQVLLFLPCRLLRAACCLNNSVSPSSLWPFTPSTAFTSCLTFHLLILHCDGQRTDW